MPLNLLSLHQSPTPSSPKVQRRFSLQLHNPLPPYYARKKAPPTPPSPPEQAPRRPPSNRPQSGRDRDQDRQRPLSQVSQPAQKADVWRPLPPVPSAGRGSQREPARGSGAARPVMPLATFAGGEPCTCSICRRAEASQRASPEMETSSIDSDDVSAGPPR